MEDRPTLTHILALRDACNRILILAGRMDEMTINDFINVNYAVDLRRRVEGIVTHLEREHEQSNRP